MFELARCYGQAPVLMSAVAQRQGLSRKHLHTLLASLREAGLVRSVRGRCGGFVLARPPKRIRLNEVLRVLEGPLSLVDCVANPRVCPRAKDCVARRVWQSLSAALETLLAGVTLEDMTSLEGKQEPARRSRAGVRRVAAARPPRRSYRRSISL